MGESVAPGAVTLLKEALPDPQLADLRPLWYPPEQEGLSLLLLPVCCGWWLALGLSV